ncbi:hypothetical protein, partial [Streptomyces ipomoeae]|uniref:hypothetical protein n=1 Tax=Streptomyces ipomoeae TaxID=103232 RepID=UPI0029CA46EF
MSATAGGVGLVAQFPAPLEGAARLPKAPCDIVPLGPAVPGRVTGTAGHGGVRRGCGEGCRG